jgi:hypothetical protein
MVAGMETGIAGLSRVGPDTTGRPERGDWRRGGPVLSREKKTQIVGAGDSGLPAARPRPGGETVRFLDRAAARLL